MDSKKTTNAIVGVLGALGYTGRFIVRDLLRRGFMPIAISRNAAALAETDFDEAVIRRVASVDDAASLDRALEGAHVVINSAGPFIDTADAVARAALRAKIHYVDVAAEQLSTNELFQNFDGPARKAGIAIVPAMAFFGGLSDLMATVLMKDWESADLVETSIGFDRWNPTRGTRNTIERKAVGNLVFVGGRLVPGAAQSVQKDWQFAEPIGRQVVVELPFSETILISRHIQTAEHRNYLTLVALSDVLDPATPPPKAADEMGRSAQRFVVEVTAQRGSERRRAYMSGNDGYALSAPLTGEAVSRLIAGNFRSTGARAPGEIFDAQEILEALGPEHAEFTAPVAEKVGKRTGVAK